MTSLRLSIIFGILLALGRVHSYVVNRQYGIGRHAITSSRNLNSNRVQLSLSAHNITELAKDRLIKEAQILRNEASLLEKNETVIVKNEEFISRYATKVGATNASVHPIESSLYVSKDEKPIIVTDREKPLSKSSISADNIKDVLLETFTKILTEEMVEGEVEGPSAEEITRKEVEKMKDFVLRKQLKSNVMNYQWGSAIRAMKDYIEWYMNNTRATDEMKAWSKLACIQELDMIEKFHQSVPIEYDPIDPDISYVDLTKTTDWYTALSPYQVSTDDLAELDVILKHMIMAIPATLYYNESYTYNTKGVQLDLREYEMHRIETLQYTPTDIDYSIANASITDDVKLFYKAQGLEDGMQGFLMRNIIDYVRKSIKPVGDYMKDFTEDETNILQLVILDEIFNALGGFKQFIVADELPDAEKLIDSMEEMFSNPNELKRLVNRVKYIQVLRHRGIIQKSKKIPRNPAVYGVTSVTYRIADTSPVLQNVNFDELQSVFKSNTTFKDGLLRMTKELIQNEMSKKTGSLFMLLASTMMSFPIQNQEYVKQQLIQSRIKIRELLQAFVTSAMKSDDSEELIIEIYEGPTPQEPDVKTFIKKKNTTISFNEVVSSAAETMAAATTTTSSSTSGSSSSSTTAEKSDSTKVKEDSSSVNPSFAALLSKLQEKKNQTTGDPIDLTESVKDTLEKENVKKSLDKLQNWLNEMDGESKTLVERLDEVEPKSVVETIIMNYFDKFSREQGKMITRVGAGLFQAEILKEIFEVNQITPLDGAYIFDGRVKARNTKDFYKTLMSRFEKSQFVNDMKFVVTKNQRFPQSNDTVTDMAYSVLTETTSVLLYPKSWNSTLLPNSFQQSGQNIMKILNVLSSAIVAGNCYNLFDLHGSFMTTGILPDGYINLALYPLLLQLLPLLIESAVAAEKGIKLSFIQIPGWFSLPTFGYRTSYLNMPKTRNDLFDTAASGWFAAFVLSLLSTLYGLYLTAESNPEIVANFPTIPLVLVKANPLVSQLFSNQFPTLISETAPKESLIHMHWLAIAGAMSLIVNTLQLVPTRQSTGMKLLYATRGFKDYNLISPVIYLMRFVFNVIWLLTYFGTPGSIFMINGRQSLLFNFFLSEIQSFLPDSGVEQLAEDDINGVTDSRKIAFAGFCFLLVFALFSDSVIELATDISNALQSIDWNGLLNSGGSATSIF